MPTEFRFSGPCVRDIEHLKRRFPLIDRDIEALRETMETSGYRGVQMSGYDIALYKVRLTNRSTRRGKSGGFRAIYYLAEPNTCMFVHFYSKTDKNDASPGEILERLRDIG